MSITHKTIRIIGTVLLLIGWAEGGKDVPVKIQKNTSYYYINQSGQKIKVERIQDMSNRLTDDFTKTSRPCPPYCIQPIRAAEGVRTIAELELMAFTQKKLPAKKGVLIDSSPRKWYDLETIPGAISIPSDITKSQRKGIIPRLFKAFGAQKQADGHYDFTSAKELVVFCGGIWCGRSPVLIRWLIAKGYPAGKIMYYRGGLQAWKLLGLTTVIHRKQQVQ